MNRCNPGGYHKPFVSLIAPSALEVPPGPGLSRRRVALSVLAVTAAELNISLPFEFWRGKAIVAPLSLTFVQDPLDQARSTEPR